MPNWLKHALKVFGGAVIALAIIGAVIQLMPGVPSWDAGTLDLTSTTAMGLLILGLVLFLLWWGLISDETVAILGAFAAFEFALWASGFAPSLFKLPWEDGFRWPGIYHIPIYGAFVLIARHVYKHTSGRLKFSAGVLIFLAFTFIGLLHLDPTTRAHLWAWIQGLGDVRVADGFWGTPKDRVKTPSRRSVSTPSACSNTWEEEEVGAVPTQVNRGATCAVRIRHPDGCLYLRRAAWTGDPKPYGPFCDGGSTTLQTAPNDIEWAWSADGRTFRVSVRRTSG